MIRFSYWQFRLPLGIALGGLAVVAVIAGVTGPGLVHLYDTTVASCVSNGGSCSAALSAFNAHDQVLQQAVQGLVSLTLTRWWSPVGRANPNRFSPALFGTFGITPLGMRRSR